MGARLGVAVVLALFAAAPALARPYETDIPAAFGTPDAHRVVYAYLWALPLVSPLGLAGVVLDAGARARQAIPGGPALPSYDAVKGAAVQGVEKMPGAVLIVVAAMALAYLLALLVTHGLTRAVLMVRT